MIFKHFPHFQSFKSVPKKSAENHAPYMKVQKWKETWDHVVPIIMANVEAKNLVISWNFQFFKHVFLSRCSTLQSRLKLSKWVTFNDFQIFSTFSEFQKRAEKISRKAGFLLYYWTINAIIKYKHYLPLEQGFTPLGNAAKCV